MNQEMKDVYHELADIYFDVFIERDEADSRYKEEYFQGKKDGLRTALVLLSPFFDKDSHWESLQETAYGQRLTKLEDATSLLKWAYRAMESWVKYPVPNASEIEHWKYQVEKTDLNLKD